VVTNIYHGKVKGVGKLGQFCSQIYWQVKGLWTFGRASAMFGQYIPSVFLALVYWWCFLDIIFINALVLWLCISMFCKGYVHFDFFPGVG
jgi:hypothetical protein